MRESAAGPAGRRCSSARCPPGSLPSDTEPRNIVARPVDSAVVAARAPWRVKCSVVTNVTAAGCGSAPPASALVFASILVVPPASMRWSQCDYRSRAGHPAGDYLTRDRGWPVDGYQGWLAETAAAVLRSAGQ